MLIDDSTQINRGANIFVTDAEKNIPAESSQSKKERFQKDLKSNQINRRNSSDMNINSPMQQRRSIDAASLRDAMRMLNNIDSPVQQSDINTNDNIISRMYKDIRRVVAELFVKVFGFIFEPIIDIIKTVIMLPFTIIGTAFGNARIVEPREENVIDAADAAVAQPVENRPRERMNIGSKIKSAFHRDRNTANIEKIVQDHIGRNNSNVAKIVQDHIDRDNRAYSVDKGFEAILRDKQSPIVKELNLQQERLINRLNEIANNKPDMFASRLQQFEKSNEQTTTPDLNIKPEVNQPVADNRDSVQIITAEPITQDNQLIDRINSSLDKETNKMRTITNLTNRLNALLPKSSKTADKSNSYLTDIVQQNIDKADLYLRSPEFKELAQTYPDINTNNRRSNR